MAPKAVRREKIGDAIASAGSDDLAARGAAIAPVAAKYGLEIDPASIGPLCEKHGLRPPG